MLANRLISTAHHSEQTRCNPRAAPSVVYIATVDQNEFSLFRQCCATYSSSIGPSFLNYFSLDGDYKYQYEAIGDMIERPVYDVLGRLTNSFIARYSEHGIAVSNSLPLLTYCLITMCFSSFLDPHLTRNLSIKLWKNTGFKSCDEWLPLLWTSFLLFEPTFIKLAQPGAAQLFTANNLQSAFCISKL